MSALLAPQRLRQVPFVLLALAALAVGLAGFEHARLFHRGYGPVDWVGPLFLLNGIASAIVVLLLVFERVRLFVLGVVAVSIPSLIAILLSHTSGFAGFHEAGLDRSGWVIVVAELAATVLVAAGALLVVREREAVA